MHEEMQKREKMSKVMVRLRSQDTATAAGGCSHYNTGQGTHIWDCGFSKRIFPDEKRQKQGLMTKQKREVLPGRFSLRYASHF